MSEQNIVVLGAAWSGFSAAHYYLKHIHKLLDKNAGYRVVMISPSDHFYARTQGPRTIVSAELLSNDACIKPITEQFASYPAGSFVHIPALAAAVDTSNRAVVYHNTKTGEESSITYHTLIIATGIRTDFDAFNNIGPTSKLEADLTEIRRQIASAKTVVIGGGGPTGVETAGEIGEFLNGSAGLFSSTPSNKKASVHLITSGDRLLPVLRPALAQKAEQYLNRVGVDVQYDTRVKSSTKNADGKHEVVLSNGETIIADVYIPAIGVKPNSSFMDQRFLNDKGYIKVDKALRIPGAGERVYAVGDVAAWQRGGIMGVFDQIPVLMTNVKKDLLQQNGLDREYEEKIVETQLVPVGRSKGVGAMMGWKLPSQMIWAMKGRDYAGWMLPWTLTGSNWSKESKWNAPPTAQAKAQKVTSSV